MLINNVLNSHSQKALLRDGSGPAGSVPFFKINKKIICLEEE